GVLYRGWGSDGSEFLHRFQPTRLIGYHFDAAELACVLGEYIRAERIDGRVERVVTNSDGAQIQLRDSGAYVCDYVFDARGFPRHIDTSDAGSEDFIEFNWIPTNRAMLRRLPQRHSPGATLALARPH